MTTVTTATTTKQPSLVGGACIIASVCVGAGMLGLPSAGAGAWTVWSVLAIALTMAVMTVSGWLLLEAFKLYDLNVSFNTVTSDLLGEKVNAFNNLTVYFVGGILLYAYTTSFGLILQGSLGLESKTASVLFVFIASSVVWHSTRAVDRISVVLICTMLLSFVFGVFGLTVHVDFSLLMDVANQQGEYAKYAMALLPIALTSFGYHHSVASMRAYYGEERKAKYAILGGTSIALFLYVIWLVSIFGHLSRDSFGPVIEQGGNVDVLLGVLGTVVASDKVSQAINIFSVSAILSSFIGVGLGVFDYIADLFHFDNRSKSGRTKTWAATFMPPLVLSLLFPFGFILAIGYAGAAATVWTCIIPALLVLKARQRKGAEQGFVVAGGKLIPYAVLLFGVATAVFHFLTMLDILPVFKG
ncbi:aromatic amino acid transporter [Vibrio algivorus]|uniref:Aromatic amino acid permease n=1 Tax=Vibrio algivorus TaxID=1667024 RepID=A0ABQ6ESM4_9VIBR|nr:aromatic amino acid transporter [Vibrio algivorus]GLT15731.1 tryptophan-specific transporter [Vibrio algivorus]